MADRRHELAPQPRQFPRRLGSIPLGGVEPRVAQCLGRVRATACCDAEMVLGEAAGGAAAHVERADQFAFEDKLHEYDATLAALPDERRHMQPTGGLVDIRLIGHGVEGIGCPNAAECYGSARCDTRLAYGGHDGGQAPRVEADGGVVAGEHP